MKFLVLYGSYRRDRKGIRLATYVTNRLKARGEEAELVDAKAVGLPILDRMYKEHDAGQAPAAMETLAQSIRGADGFVFVAGEYNHGVQPGLKNLTDHFLEEWFWRPAAIATYSMGGFGGVRAMYAWRASLAEMGMPSISSVLAVSRIHKVLDESGEPFDGEREGLDKRFARFADDLTWWARAAKAQREAEAPPF